MWRQFPENQRILLETLAERPEGEGVAALARATRSTPELVLMDLKRLESRSTLEQIPRRRSVALPGADGGGLGGAPGG